jgi:hypothetical protein
MAMFTAQARLPAYLWAPLNINILKKRGYALTAEGSEANLLSHEVRFGSTLD